jgi:hypothetical protein
MRKTSAESDQTQTSTSTSSRWVTLRSSACCSSAIGCVSIHLIVNCMSAPSGSLQARTGSTHKTTPMPRPQWSRKFLHERRKRLEKRCARKISVAVPNLPETHIVKWLLRLIQSMFAERLYVLSCMLGERKAAEEPAALIADSYLLYKRINPGIDKRGASRNRRTAHS